jgi:hypothetical protein
MVMLGPRRSNTYDSRLTAILLALPVMVVASIAPNRPPTVPIVDARKADIDPASAAAHRRGRNTRLPERFQSHLEQYPLLRVHLPRFPRGDPEKSRVESRNVADRTRSECIGGAGFSLVRTQERILNSAVGFDRGTSSRAANYACHRVSSAPSGNRNEKPITDHPRYVPVICHVRIAWQSNAGEKSFAEINTSGRTGTPLTRI